MTGESNAQLSGLYTITPALILRLAKPFTTQLTETYNHACYS
jgi:hypothetical protein